MIQSLRLDSLLTWWLCGTQSGYMTISSQHADSQHDNQRFDLLVPDCEVVLVPSEANLQIVVFRDDCPDCNASACRTEVPGYRCSLQ